MACVFEQMMHRGRIETSRDLHELERMLCETIERGFVEEIAVSRKAHLKDIWSEMPFERWFLEKETGVIFALIYPWEIKGEGRGTHGKWERVLDADMMIYSSAIH